MKFLFIIILFGLFLQANCLFAFWQAGHNNVSYYKCIKPTVNNRVILILSDRQDKIYQDDLQNIQDALDAGLVVELVNFPTRCQPLDEGLKNLSKNLAGKPIDRFWGRESIMSMERLHSRRQLPIFAIGSLNSLEESWFKSLS